MPTRTPRTRISPLAWRGRRRRWRVGTAAAALLVAVALAWADRAGWGWYGGDDLSRYDGRDVRVVRVVDGDTLDVDLPDARTGRPTTRIRLWGIDTPEIAHAARPDLGRAATDAEPWADQARRRTAELVAEGSIRLELEPHRQRGRYGRLLAYVRLPDGRLLNEALLAEGLARLETRWSHRLMERFRVVDHEARRQRLGLWRGGVGADETSRP